MKTGRRHPEQQRWVKETALSLGRMQGYRVGFQERGACRTKALLLEESNSNAMESLRVYGKV